MEQFDKFIEIRHKHKHELEVEENRFNVFKLLEIEHKENVLHSKLIGYLLNPSATHGLNNTFLNLFLETCKLPSSKSQNFRLKLEHYIGAKDLTLEEGGRIDIYLENDASIIAIENKIYAIDQEKQLTRYVNYLKEQNKQKYLLYLTLTKERASNEILDTDKVVYQHITYSKEIIIWIKECIKFLTTSEPKYPVLKQTLEQYLETIKKLCNKQIPELMEKELLERISSNSDAFKTYTSLRALHPDTVWYGIVEKNITEKLQGLVIAKKVIKELNSLEATINDTSIYMFVNLPKYKDETHSILFYNQLLQSKNLYFGFEWNAEWELEYGFKYMNPEQKLLDSNYDHLEELKNKLNLDKDNEAWYAYGTWQKHKVWNNNTIEQLAKAIDGEVLADMKNVLEQVFGK